MRSFFFWNKQHAAADCNWVPLNFWYEKIRFELREKYLRRYDLSVLSLWHRLNLQLGYIAASTCVPYGRHCEWWSRTNFSAMKFQAFFFILFFDSIIYHAVYEHSPTDVILNPKAINLLPIPLEQYSSSGILSVRGVGYWNSIFSHTICKD